MCGFKSRQVRNIKETVFTQRLSNQMISDHISTGPTEVVRRLGALQAQDYEAAFWAIGLHCSSDNTRSDVQSALAVG